jgi:hypothetical protein
MAQAYRDMGCDAGMDAATLNAKRRPLREAASFNAMPS